MPLKSAEDMGINLDDNTPPADSPPPAESSFAPTSAEPNTEAVPKGDIIPTVKPKPRREAATERLVEERLAAEREQYKRDIAERDARYERHMQELRDAIARQQQPPPTQQQTAAPQYQGPDPAQLRREAKKAIDNRDFDEYERLRDQAAAIERDQAIAKAVEAIKTQQPQTNQPQQQPPWLIGMWGRFPRVASPKGEALMTTKLQEINILTGKVGPELFEAAFQAVDKILGGDQQAADAGRPQFSQANAPALSGVKPGNAATAPSGDPVKGVQLSDLERKTARAFKISDEEYAEWLAKTRPERVVSR